jgi:hypothetical protein
MDTLGTVQKIETMTGLDLPRRMAAKVLIGKWSGLC